MTALTTRLAVQHISVDECAPLLVIQPTPSTPSQPLCEAATDPSPQPGAGPPLSRSTQPASSSRSAVSGWRRAAAPVEAAGAAGASSSAPEMNRNRASNPVPSNRPFE